MYDLYAYMFLPRLVVCFNVICVFMRWVREGNTMMSMAGATWVLDLGAWRTEPINA